MWIDSLFEVEPLAEAAGFRVTLHLSGASAPAELCLDSQTTNEIPCPEDGAGSLLIETNPSSHASHDSATGKIVLETSLDDAEPFGFRLAENHQPGSGDAFSLLGPTDVKGRILRFELYPSRLHDVLSYYSGELKIIGTDGFGHEVVEHQGATNLMAN